MSTPPFASGPPLRRAGTVLTLLASALQVLSAFHRWDPELGHVGLDIGLRGGPAPAEPGLVTIGAVLLVLAALPALAALVTVRGWPRAMSAVATAALVLAWISLGPVGSVPPGVWLAAAGACGHLVAAALARP
ncbi:MAG: hypothetical protein KY461_13445 [Actinobacteria bacterium]|nr:hypothetical protein [Actinomycetota bacterium]